MGLFMRACCHIAAVLVLIELASGCAWKRQCTQPSCPPPPVAIDCQSVERQPLNPDVSLVAYSQPPLGWAYCNLPEKDAQCLAAANSANARLLEQEANALGAQASGHHRASSIETMQQILSLQAAQERNRSAFAALQLLLRIAEAEAGADNLRQRLQQVDQTLTDVGRLQAAGLAAPISQPEVQAQRLDLEHKFVELELTLDQLNGQLANLLGSEPPPGTRYWPDIDLKVDPVVPAVAEAQSLAMVQRADLAALRLAANSGERGNLDAMRSLLAQSHAGLGHAASGCGLIALVHFRAREDEAGERQGQLLSVVADQERTTRHDVAQSITTIHARLAQIDLTHRRLDFLEQHRAALRRKAEAAPAASFDGRKAALDRLAAEQDLFHDVIEWKLAAVKLRELEGELAIECGYTAALECAAVCCH